MTPCLCAEECRSLLCIPLKEEATQISLMRNEGEKIKARVHVCQATQFSSLV